MSFNNPFKKILTLSTIAAAAGAMESSASAADIESGLSARGDKACEQPASTKPVEVLKVKPTSHDTLTGTASGRMMEEEVLKDVDPKEIEKPSHFEKSSDIDDCQPLTS
jgi:hypothetical protein